MKVKDTATSRRLHIRTRKSSLRRRRKSLRSSILKKKFLRKTMITNTKNCKW